MPGKPMKLVYFDLRARGDPIRLALEIGGQEWEDERISREEHQSRLVPSHHEWEPGERWITDQLRSC